MSVWRKKLSKFYLRDRFRTHIAFGGCTSYISIANLRNFDHIFIRHDKNYGNWGANSLQFTLRIHHAIALRNAISPTPPVHVCSIELNACTREVEDTADTNLSSSQSPYAYKHVFSFRTTAKQSMLFSQPRLENREVVRISSICRSFLVHHPQTSISRHTIYRRSKNVFSCARRIDTMGLLRLLIELRLSTPFITTSAWGIASLP